MSSPSMDEAATKEELRPVKKQLVCCIFLSLSFEHVIDSYVIFSQETAQAFWRGYDKVAILKDSLAAIGRRIEAVLQAKQANGEDCERWRRHLWT